MSKKGAGRAQLCVPELRDFLTNNPKLRNMSTPRAYTDAHVQKNNAILSPFFRLSQIVKQQNNFVAQWLRTFLLSSL